MYCHNQLIMAPRSAYILPQGFQSNMSVTGDKVTHENVDFTKDNQGFSAISIFKQTLPDDELLLLDDQMQIDDTDPQQISMITCSCHKSKARRSLLHEFELEAIRLGPCGPWPTKPRSQYKRSKCMRKILNDPVKQVLFK